jgi:hypothetical protein
MESLSFSRKEKKRLILSRNGMQLMYQWGYQTPPRKQLNIKKTMNVHLSCGGKNKIDYKIYIIKNSNL